MKVQPFSCAIENQKYISKDKNYKNIFFLIHMYDKLISKKKISYFFVMYFLWEKNKLKKLEFWSGSGSGSVTQMKRIHYTAKNSTLLIFYKFHR